MFEVTDNELKQIIMSTLFVSGEGIELIEFTEKFGRSLEQIKMLTEEMKNEIPLTSGIQLISYANKIQLSSNPQYAEKIAAVLNPIREKALTKAAMQTLAIIAYKQPITRLDIENIRGVSADYAIQVLIENNMIQIVGRKDVVGKPLLYGTTEEFLKRFDLSDVNGLPDYNELLERIKLIREENAQKSDNLYKDYQIKDEGLPAYLTEQKRLSEDEIKAKQEKDNQIVRKLKDIDSVIKSTKIEEPKPEMTAEAQTDTLESNVQSEIATAQTSDKDLEEIFSKVISESKEESSEDNSKLA